MLLILSVSAVAFAQSAPPTPSNVIMKKLSDRGTGKGIKVTEIDGTRLKGVLVSLDTTGFQITVEGANTPTRIEYNQVKSVAGSGGLSTAGKIAIGVLIGFTVVVLVIVIALKSVGL